MKLAADIATDELRIMRKTPEVCNAQAVHIVPGVMCQLRTTLYFQRVGHSKPFPDSRERNVVAS